LNTDIDYEQLEALLTEYGVARDYLNYAGETVPLAWESRLKILQLQGVDVSASESIAQAFADLNNQRFHAWLPKATVITAEQTNEIPLQLNQIDLAVNIEWQITTEQGEVHQGEVSPLDLSEIEVHVLASHTVSTRLLPLPALPAGYHEIILSSMTQRLHVMLIAAPMTAYQPEWCFENRKLGGLSVQVYSLQSDRNWGVGDFSDLQTVALNAASQGIDFLVLNPLHLLDARYPESCSPYSPMDRRFLNPIYIDPSPVEDYYDNVDLVAYVNQESIQQQLGELRQLTNVDYTAVSSLKYHLYDGMYRHFKTHHLDAESPRAEAFNIYVEGKGEAGQVFAEDQAVNKTLNLGSASDPNFHLYLQWLSEIQLETCQQIALANGMAVGLVRDLAVASSGGSAEVQLNPELFCTAASIGAPPDPLAPQGQNWGLPPMKPTELVNSGFAHFIDLLQNNMSHCGALRIDHIMALMRLWWCPGQGDSSAGAYVYYPVAELFAILRLESTRQQCVVIGEDLGVVPPEIRERMAHSAIFSNALFYFEKYDNVTFKRPEHYPHKALSMIANHDVPTLAAWWNKTDIELRDNIGLFNNEHEKNSAIQARESDLIQVLHWVNNAGLLPETWQDFNIHRPFDYFLCRAIFHTGGRAASQMISVQLEDLCLTELPVNIPGTSTEYPNWRRKLPAGVESLLQSDDAKMLLAGLAEGRSQS